jgi:hypothetical protein
MIKNILQEKWLSFLGAKETIMRWCGTGLQKASSQLMSQC